MTKKSGRSGEFLPTTREAMHVRGWHEVDVVLVTGDAYVDHPSFGIALIGRLLEAEGYRVAVLAQPHYHSPEPFREFGRPRLFFGISAGNLDSIVANYTGNGKVRDADDYSPGGNPYFGTDRTRGARRRPDRATIVYAQLARAACGDVPIVLGGLEASLRRFIHYDFKQNKLRTSVLTDAKADLLVYGMGERAVLEIVRRLDRGEPLHGIAGTCERLSDAQFRERHFETEPLLLPSWQDVQSDGRAFMEAELALDRHARALSPLPLLQRQQAMWVLQNRPSPPLDSAALDALYTLPFTREPHPSAGTVPAHTMIRHSVTIVRGCYGNCSFCAISRHQGPLVTSRSRESVLEEIQRITQRDDFHGTISDLGGPTANMYGTSCGKASPCSRHDCLYPRVCPHLLVDEGAFIDLLESASRIQGVRNVYISSGLRMELLLATPELLDRLVERHIPGAMKIAPEHTEPEVLRLMHKQSVDLLPRFLKTCRDLAAKRGREIHFTPYFISAHPGCTQEHMEALVRKARNLGLTPRQFQDFTPTPATLSTAMYVTGLDRYTMKPVYTARASGERSRQRCLLEGAPQRGRKQSRPPLPRR